MQYNNAMQYNTIHHQIYHLVDHLESLGELIAVPSM